MADPWASFTPVKPAAADPWSGFRPAALDSGTAQTRPRAASPALPRSRYGSEIESEALRLDPSLRVTGRERTATRNAQVGGVPNSAHLTDNARDFGVGPGETLEQARSRLQKTFGPKGYKVLLEGAGAAHSTAPHLHIEATSSAQDFPAGDPWAGFKPAPAKAAAPAKPAPVHKPAPDPYAGRAYHQGPYGNSTLSAPAPRSLLERAKDAMHDEAYSTSLMQTAGDAVFSHIPGMKRQIVAQRANEAGMRDRRDSADPAWHPGWANLPGNLARKSAEIIGGTVGGVDPTYLIGGPGKNIARRAAFQGGFQGFRDSAQQLLRMHAGQQDKFDPSEAGKAAAGGALLHAGGEAAAPVLHAALHPSATAARVGAGYAAGGVRGAARAATDRGFVTGNPENWRYTGGTPGEINKAGARRAASAAGRSSAAAPFNPGNRKRGADHAVQVMDDAANAGHIPRETAEFGKWFVRKNPTLANEVSVTVQRGGRGLQGFYDPTSRLVALMKGDTMDRTAVHELLHHTERLLPDKSREAIRTAWSKSVDTLARGPAHLQSFAKAIRDFEANPTEAGQERVQRTMPGMKYYQYVNPSEFWAENGSRLLAARRTAEGGRFAGAALWLKEFAEHAKHTLGLQSDAPALRAINDVLSHKTGKSEGSMLTGIGKISDPTTAAMAGASERPEIGPAARPPSSTAPILRSAKALREAVSGGHEAEVYADLQRRIVGKHKLDAARAAADLAKHQRVVGNASEEEQRALIHSVETRSQGGAMGMAGPMRQAADAIRKVATDYRSRIEAVMQKAGSEENVPKFVQDYYVHLWKNSPKEVEAAMISKQGSGRNLKKRSIPTYAEGLEAGLVPVHENPLDAMTAYVDNMSRFLAAHELRGAMHKSGLAKWEFEKAAEPGRIKLNGGHTVIDAMLEPGKEGVSPDDLPAPKMIPRRILTASPEVAKRYNAFVDPGLATNLRRQGKNKRAFAVDAGKKAGGMVGNLALTGSGFHPALVAGKAVGSELAVGVNHLLRGRPAEAAKTLWYAPTAPVRAAYAGRQMGKRLLEGDHAMTEIDNLWRDAGNRFNNGSVYRASIRPNFLTSGLRGTLRGDIKSALKATTRGTAGMRAAAVADLVPRALETFSAPVFDHYVPAIKRGVFEREMGAELEANPNWTAAEKRAAARRISDNIDGRMGELSTDNIFWSQTRTDALRLAFLSPSWAYGDVRLVLDAMRDAPKSVTGLFQGKGLGHGTAAAVGIVSSYFLMNGIANYLYTGERPEGEDWIAFRTGGTEADGTPERSAVPSVMKDFFGAMRDPVGEAENKLHPLGRAVSEVATNKDWRGLPVYRPNNVEEDDLDQIKNDIPDNLKGSRVAAALKHLGGTVVPYGLQPNANGENSNISWASKVGLGLKPAGKQFTDPESYEDSAKKRSIQAVSIEASAEAKAKARQEKP